MGMAASQARYLALVARKSNCEYEGQQINQARLALSNESANLFNQMLDMKVPVPPSTLDYTKTQYSFTDGYTITTIDNWKQLSTADPDYNYIVTYHYNSDIYTGIQKRMNDPQVQFSNYTPSSVDEAIRNIGQIEQALQDITEAQKAYDAAKDRYDTAVAQASRLQTYKDGTKPEYAQIATSEITYDPDNLSYTINNSQGTFTFNKYDDTNIALREAVNTWIANKAISETDKSNIFYRETADGFELAFGTDLANLRTTGGPLFTYNTGRQGDPATPDLPKSIYGAQKELEDLNTALSLAQMDLQTAKAQYSVLNVPAYVGNCPLTPIETFTDDELTEIRQIIKDMSSQEIECTFNRCFTDGTFTNEGYTGGIYKFTLNGQTYYASIYDLAESAVSGTGNNYIDNQDKLSYYYADFINTKIENTSKALLETDKAGRFSTIRFEDDTVCYSLNMETITDDAAYEDAMNQYYYENAKYDKMVQDINAKTSIIQAEDRTLELRLKQLDTEQNALKTEMDAVQKIVKDNVEASFKTFGG